MKLLTCWVAALCLLATTSYLGFVGIEAAYAARDRGEPWSPRRTFWGPAFDLDERSDRVVELGDGAIVAQEFAASGDFHGLKVQMVTWFDHQEDYPCSWTLHEVRPDGSWTEPLRQGVFSSLVIGDWGYLPLRFERLPGGPDRVYVLTLRSSEGKRAGMIGVPLWPAAGGAGADHSRLWSGRQGEPASTRIVHPDHRIRIQVGSPEAGGVR